MITTFSTIAMVLYPALVSHLNLDPLQTGRFLGGSIHDVAQVVAAGYATSPQAGDSATIVKLMRVAMLLPVVLIITLMAARGNGKRARPGQGRAAAGLPHCLRHFGRTERIFSGRETGGLGSDRSVQVAIGHFGGRVGNEDQLARNDGRRYHRDRAHRGGDGFPGAAGIGLDHPVRQSQHLMRRKI